MVNISLSDYNLNGGLPKSIGDFPQLTSLDLGENYLVGSIPDTITALSSLVRLVLQENNLNGTIPANIGDLTNLEDLGFKNNTLTGSIPDSIGSLLNLTICDFYKNELTGTIPDAFAKLINIQYLDLYENKLWGTIPPYLDTMRNLTYLYVGENDLTGTIPENIGTLSRLVSFYANTNKLWGTIPSSFANLANLQYLFLYQNRLEGNLAGRFNPARQNRLIMVVLYDNQLTGQLPEELFQLPNLTVVDCSTNCMGGSLPSSVCSARRLETLALDGMCAAETCRIKLITGLPTYRLEHTITGGVPRCLYELPRLTTLHISGNGMTGSLPANLSLSPTFVDLGLSHNFLKNDLPSEVQMRRWHNLDLSFNRIGGTLDENFAPQPVTGTLKLANNRLSGAIPNTILDSLGTVDILDGNLFACKFDRSDLPEQDKKQPSYQCGSNSFNVSYYFWLSATGALALIVLVYTVREKGGNVTVVGAFVEAVANLRSILNVTNMKDAAGNEIKHKLRRYKRVCDISKLFARLAGYVLCFIILVLLPFYGLMAIRGSTLKIKYAYRVSIIYMTGTTAAAVAMLLLILLTIYTFFCFAYLLRQFQRQCVMFEKEIEFDQFAGSRDSYSAHEKSFTLEKLMVYSSLVLVDVVVVVGANVLFIYVVIYRDDTLLPVAQAALSLFKILWSNVCSWTIYYLAVYIDFKSRNIRRAIFSLLFMVTLFNNIVVPCLVVMAASSTCFYNLAVQGSNIESSYDYQECLAFRDGACYEYTMITSQSSFRPPFIYSYQCAASFVTSYAPSFVYLCIISGFIIPSMRYIGYTLVRWASPTSLLHRALLMVLPPVLKPIPPDGPMLRSRGPFFDARRFLVNLLNYLGVLMTFGAAFPPLAVAITATIVSTVFYTRLEVKRFVAEAAQLNLTGYVDIIDADCFGVGSDTMVLRAVRVLLVLSYCFYTLFIFDTLGDEVKFGQSLWVLIVMPAIPFVLDFLFRAYSGPMLVRTKIRLMSSVSAASKMILELKKQVGQDQEEPGTPNPMTSSKGDEDVEGRQGDED